MADSGFLISGISARFPQADDVVEFKEKLYAGVDFVTEDEARWPRGLLGVPARMGTIRDLTRFDAQFFNVPPKQADVMDPQLRILLETTYEAIVDAGYDPMTLRGRKVGVFAASVVSETFGCRNSYPEKADGYTVLGSLLSSLSNRVSYCFDFRGPSVTVDTASSSCMTALNQAMLVLRSGQCEAAIVCGSNLLLNPCSTLNAMKLNMLSPDGRCKTFDKDANGYARSETVGAMFLQRECDARRVYAKIIHVMSNADGYKIEGPTYPSRSSHEQLLREVYAGAKVDPRDVFYVEAHGTGTQAGDLQECGAFSAVLCPPGRKEPLKIGSVKSNVGHSEGASCICAMTKVILAMETGIISRNLHFNEPNPNIHPLQDGSLEVVSENTPFPGGLIGVHSCGVGGSNIHAILESNPGPHADHLPRQKRELPRLVLMAGRSQDSLKASQDRLISEGPCPDSAYALLNKVGQPSAKHFPYRGYAMIPVDDSGREVLKEAVRTPTERRPLWFAFTGVGCQWPGMARQMMQFDVFATSIQQSHNTLEELGVDLITIITAQEDQDQSLAAIVAAIVAIQMALVDALNAIGVHPDGILGHSLGEISCGYADGSLSAEQALSCAYWRGRCMEMESLTEGAMAVVGLTWEKAKQRCTDGVEAACDNAEDSVTVSGPVQAVAKLVQELSAENVSARMVDTMKVAFHSSHIRSVGPALRKAFEKVIPEPKPRSEHWISTSLPEYRWNEPVAKYCSADYYLNNVLSPVLFRQALQRVPPDAIVVEIAPHCLLQPILLRGMGPRANFVGLMKRNADNVSFFLSSMGKLHTLGVQMDLSPLYPPVPWPVPRGTPSIGHLVAWDHTQSWNVVSWKECISLEKGAHERSPSEELVKIDLGANEDRYLADHKIGGQVLFPFSGYLLLVWKYLAKRCGKPYNEVPVIFENVTVHQATTLSPSDSVQFSVSIMHISGEFEVRQAGLVAASGTVRIAVEEMSIDEEYLSKAEVETNIEEMESDDVYRELRMRGYEYGLAFKGIIKAGIQKPFGKLKWADNWVTFTESMFQFATLTSTLRTANTPCRLQFCLLDPRVHARFIQTSLKCGTGVDVIYNHRKSMCRAGGVLLRGIVTSSSTRCTELFVPTLEQHCFLPYMDDEVTTVNREADVQEYINVCCSFVQRLLDSSSTEEYFNSDITKSSRDMPTNILKSYLEKCSEKQGILQTLLAFARNRSIDSSLDIPIKSAHVVNEENIENDLLNTALFTDDALGHLLSVVVENTSVKKIRVLELASQVSLFAPWILPLLSQSNKLLRVQYTVALTSPDKLENKEVPEGANVVRWDQSLTATSKQTKVDLIAMRGNALTSKDLKGLAEELHGLSKVNGFVLVSLRTALTSAEMFLDGRGKFEFQVHTISKMKTHFSVCGFRLVSLKSNNTSALLLFRKLPLQERKVEVIRIPRLTSDLAETIKHKVNEYESKPVSENLWFLATGSSGVVGLAKCLRHEAGGDHVRCILDTSIDQPGNMTDLRSNNPAYKDVMEGDLVMNVYQNGHWGSYRHAAVKTGDAPKRNTEFAVLATRTCGDLGSLQWVESPLGYALPQSSRAGAECNLCSVYYAPVNPSDGMLTFQKTPLTGFGRNAEYGLGQEFSGRDSERRRVMGVVPSNAMATMVAGDPILFWEVPESWSLLEASTVPLAYSGAYYALLVRGNMRPGDAVLVHFGSSDVGQAAISIALSTGCSVFTTVGTNEERESLQTRFPQMEDWRFTNFHDVFLQDHIWEHTEGRGVNLVLNCDNGDLPCYSGYPRINVHRTSKNPLLGTVYPHWSSINIATDVLEWLHRNDARALADKHRVAQLVHDGIISGTVRPLDAAVFPAENAVEAFRLLGSGTNVKKVVLKIRPEESQQNPGPFPPFTMEAVSKTYFYAHKAYIIVGTLCVFDMELADWMIARGCRKLILCTGSEVHTGYQRLCLHRWKNSGTKARVISADISIEEGAREAIKEAAAMGPVGGIFNLATVMPSTKETETFAALCEQKIDGTRHMDQLSRELCPQLDHFVVFSSGQLGLATHERVQWCYANSTVKHICERRAAAGMPGLAVQWSGIDGNSGTSTGDEFFGSFGPEKTSFCLELMEQILNQGHPAISCKIKAAASCLTTGEDKAEPELIRAVAKILGFEDPSKIDPTARLVDLGMDSVMGVEVLHAIQRICGLELCMENIRLLSLNALVDMGASRKDEKRCSRNED